MWTMPCSAKTTSVQFWPLRGQQLSLLGLSSLSITIKFFLKNSEPLLGKPSPLISKLAQCTEGLFEVNS